MTRAQVQSEGIRVTTHTTGMQWPHEESVPGNLLYAATAFASTRAVLAAGQVPGPPGGPPRSSRRPTRGLASDASSSSLVVSPWNASADPPGGAMRVDTGTAALPCRAGGTAFAKTIPL